MAVTLTKLETQLFAEARRGNYNAFSSHFFRLPYSGTRYTPEDRVTEYELLFEQWAAIGKPEQTLVATSTKGPMEFKIEWDDYYSGDPVFLFPHGYLFFPWSLAMLNSGKEICVVEGGTGASKTSASGLSAIIQATIYPGSDFLNVAPTGKQAADMLEEVAKWVPNGDFERFIVRTPTGALFRQKPHPTLTLDVYGYTSTFMCMTVGTDFRFGLGTNYDAIRVDEAGLMDNIGEAVPPLVTRVRGERRTGRTRGVLPFIVFSSNPHRGNIGYDELKEKAKKRTNDPLSKWHWSNPDITENTSITRRQMDFQSELMTDTEQRRWHRGQDDMFETMGKIPMTVIEECRAPYLDDLVAQEAALCAQEGRYADFEENESMGIMHYELPPILGQNYLVWGDPGTANADIQNNNVPTVGVWDMTDFPNTPARLWAFRIFSGGGMYTPWMDEMERLMRKYMAVIGTYDATGMGKAFAEWPALQDLFLHGVSLSGGNKHTARTMFVLFSGAGLFAWPYLTTLWRQASAYREEGVGLHKIPDDVLAGMFVSSFYLRYEFYEELSKRLNWQDTYEVQTNEFKKAANARATRYARGARLRTAKVEEPYGVVPE